MVSPTVLLLKGNGPISINNELVELHPVTTAHGAIGFPLKSLRTENVCLVENLEIFWEAHKAVDLKPCCFVYAYDGLTDTEQTRITAMQWYQLDHHGTLHHITKGT